MIALVGIVRPALCRVPDYADYSGFGGLRIEHDAVRVGIIRGDSLRLLSEAGVIWRASRRSSCNICIGVAKSVSRGQRSPARWLGPYRNSIGYQGRHPLGSRISGFVSNDGPPKRSGRPAGLYKLLYDANGFSSSASEAIGVTVASMERVAARFGCVGARLWCLAAREMI